MIHQAGRLALFAFAIGTGSAYAQTVGTGSLELTDQPTATGSTLAPNILVAIDNSGSMDFETLFDTTEGELYVTGDEPYTDRSGKLDSPTSRNAYGYVRYAYLFPNGYASSRGDGGMLYNADYPIPPTIQFAFARSSAYNRSYFDPDNTYEPWTSGPDGTPNYPSLDSRNEWENAPYDPTRSNIGTIDLTGNRRERGNGQEFYFTDGMDAAHLTYYNGRRWEKVGGSASSAADQFLAIQYFPATFYMPDTWSPPADFGWTGAYDKARDDATEADYQPTQGRDPSGDATLKRYKLVRGNFSSDAAYARAMTNFANWFTYYRKRNLAIRGGVTAAFDRIGNVRVGACTINEANQRVARNDFDRLEMLELTDDTDRSSFYESIYDMDFYQARGTPNRPALYYLGRELESNTDIIQSPCQRNYALLFTDGFNSGTVSGIGNVDGKYGSSDGASPIPDTYSNTIADIAMRFYKELDPPNAVDVDNQLAVPAGCPEDPTLDCEPSLHMSTFGVTLGQQGVMFDNRDDYGPENANPFASPPPWYRDQSDDRISGSSLPVGGISEIDDLWHAAINSRGALLNAASPQEIATRFTAALSQILGRGETLTNATGDSRALTTDSRVFQTRYRTTDWSGDLIAYKAVGGDTTTGGRDWNAAAGLAGFSEDGDDTRTIITALRDGTAPADVNGRPFTTETVGNGRVANLSDDEIRYLRGDRRLEQSNGGSLRDRPGAGATGGTNTVLGDIIHSVPEYVGTPSPIAYAGPWRDELYPGQSMAENDVPYYSATDDDSFVRRMQSRTPMVYVGANDGMLHGFDAATGAERLAFMPNEILHIIGSGTGVTSPQYGHQSYVDGQLASADVFYGNAWHSVLVGGLRNGGRSIYALDISSPARFSEANAAEIVRWEFTHDQLGQTFGEPVIARLHGASGDDTKGRWAAIFGNGYNSDDAGASLFVVDIADGSLITRLSTGATAGDDQPSNGLSSPAVLDIDNDRVADYVYAGDFQGNLWKFDLTAANATSWTAERLFRARRGSDSGEAQPITAAPVAQRHPYGKSFGAMVYFGTGQNIVPLNNEDERTPSSLYGIWDPAVVGYSAPQGLPAQAVGWRVSRSQLVTQNVTGERTGADDTVYRTLSSKPVAYVAEDDTFGARGWALDLPAESGEAALSPPDINLRESRAEFATTVIDPETCTLTSSGFLLAVDLATGGTPGNFVFDVNDNGRIDSGDDLAVGAEDTVVAAGMAFESGSVGELARFIDRDNSTIELRGLTTNDAQINMPVSDTLFSGRRTWREIRD
ncbi:hypothetical protein SAHL_14355 [Salinisphaera orenii YIM 95161]|uniref:PilY1 beta-propeller domain-containing protein n=1 Tax=Salinisphaera orenii YIM 95161 TaxID=1051139 RepID=A0A423PIW0_9GAMM|nr:hypothetical protein SAHL_14355 [Salinisphaera halophila YIM 95161]